MRSSYKVLLLYVIGVIAFLSAFPAFGVFVPYVIRVTSKNCGIVGYIVRYVGVYGLFTMVYMSIFCVLYNESLEV